mgnify:FL=1
MATSTNKGGSYGTAAVSEEFIAANTISVSYVAVGAASSPLTEVVPAGSVALQLAPAGSYPAIPNGVIFDWMGKTYTDNGFGVIFRDAAIAPPGIQSGTMNYANCVAVLDDWVVGPNPQTILVKRLWTRKPRWTTSVIFGRTASAPIKPGGMTLTATATDGSVITATVENTGNIDTAEAQGVLDFASGAYQIMFGGLVLDSALTAAEKAEWWYDAAEVGEVEAGKIWRPIAVDPTSLRYNAVTYLYLPIDGELMGVTPERLPPDGRMPFARAGDYAVIGVTIEGSAFAPVVGTTYNVGQTLLSSIDVLDEAGTGQVYEGYTVDLDAGTLVINDITGWPARVIVRGRAEVYRRVSVVQVDGTVTLTMPIGRIFPVGSVFSTAVRYGNKQAYVARLFDQITWSGTTWLDYLDGNAAPGTYNATAHPIEVNNRGTITERWALKFRNDGVTFDLIGEHLGQIASGTVNTDFSPPNAQADNAAYFTLRAAGWGAGWSAGNVVFLHTEGAEMSFGLVRSTMPSSPSALSYSATLAIRGDKDRAPSNPFA